MKLKTEKEKTNKKKKRIGLIIFLIILLILGIAGGIFAYKVHKNGGGVSGLVSAIVGNDENTLADLDTFYCVLLGKSQNLTDTLMLVAYNPNEQKASLLSIPRDTFVGKDVNKAKAEEKINAVYSYYYYYGAAERTVETIREITGINVEKYMLIDTEALVEAVDLIGGVYFDVPVDMNYTSLSQGLNIDLKKGYQLLDGNKAEQLVRFRHNADGSTYPTEYGEEDLGRTKTQRAFLTELAKQTLKPQNILKIGGFLDIFYKNVKTNITLDEIKAYIPYMVKFNPDNLKTGIVPGTPDTKNGVAIYIHDKEGTAKVVKELFGDIESSEAEGTKIEVLNGTGDASINKTIEEKLKGKGYDVISVEKTTDTSRTSIINRNSKDETVNEIKELLGVGVRTSTDSEGEANITIILGKDYLSE